MASMALAGRVAVVTGASSGIGRAAALALARHGCRVVLAARGKPRLDAVAAEIKKAGGTCTTVSADVRTEQGYEAIVAKAVDKFGAVHVAFLNAGEFKKGETIAELNKETYDYIVGLNMGGVFWGLKVIGNAIVKSTNGDGTGAIVVNGSSLADRPKLEFAGASVHCACKAAAVYAVKFAAIEWAGRMRVNGVAPGIIATAHFDADPKTAQEKADALAAKTQLVPRAGLPEDIANLVVFLLSAQSRLVTGEVINADQGLHLK